MIVTSLLLILVAVVLLVLGLAGGSSVLLILSIAASLLAAVALVAGARQAAAGHEAAARGGPRWRERTPTGPAYGYRRSAEPEIPVQHVPPTVDPGGSGWRQPPEPPETDRGTPTDAPADGEPAAQDVTPADAARVARLDAEVRVVDGRPRYHLSECVHLVGREHEPLPVGEAVELGFTPCGHCTPDAVLLADARRR